MDPPAPCLEPWDCPPYPSPECPLPALPANDEDEGDKKGCHVPAVGPGENAEECVVRTVELVRVVYGDVVQVHVEQLVAETTDKDQDNLEECLGLRNITIESKLLSLCET